MKNKKFYILITNILICGCNSGALNGATINSSNNDIPEKRYPIKDNDSNSIFTLGGTYDTMSNHPTDTVSCLIAESDPNNMYIENPSATMDFSQSSTSEVVKNALDTSITAKVGWGPFSVSSSYHYANTSEDDDYTLNLNYIFQYAGQYKFKESTLTPGNNALISQARVLVESGDWMSFRQMCGDSFISHTNAGLSLLMKISLHFHSKVEKDIFDDSMVQAGGLDDILNEIINNKSGMKFNLEASGIQVGGNPDLLNQLFTNYGGQIGPYGYPVLNCGTNESVYSNCTNIIKQVITYSKTVTNQLSDNTSYYQYNPTPEIWSELGIHVESLNPDPATLKAMRDLTSQYATDLDSLTFLTNYYPMLESANLLSSNMRANLSSLINSYQQVLNIYTNPQNKIMNCFNGFVTGQCIQIHDNIFNQRANILQNPYLNNLLSYINNNQYYVSLLKTDYIDLLNRADCMLSPITDNSQNLYLINCDGQINGSLDLVTGTSIRFDQLYNLLILNNLNYNYYQPSLGNLYFTYNVYQPISPDLTLESAWSGYLPAIVNGNYLGLDKLTIKRINAF